jgi:hypothetical protein
VFVPIAKTIAGPDAFKNSYGLQLARFSYCPNDPVGGSPASKFMARLKAFDPVQYEKGAYTTAAGLYDGVYILKAAVEANGGSTGGPEIAKWIEEKSGSLDNLVSGVPEPSKDSHFLIGPKSVALVSRPDLVRSDGLQARVGC